MALRDLEAAAAALDVAAAIERDTGLVIGGNTSGFADQFEAHWHLGEAESLAGDLAAFTDAMERMGHRTMQGLAARCHALVAPPDRMDRTFADAVKLLRADTSRFEEARTRLLWGQRLRRARRKANARTQLRQAEEVFVRLGAGTWLTTCRSELAACGERRVRGSDVGTGLVETLTPREFEVAREVAGGASNAEAARRLYISERTVEFHLSRAYRKLQVTGRADLQAALA